MASGDLLADFDIARIEGALCRVVWVAASPSGRNGACFLATGHSEGWLRLWVPRAREQITQLRGHTGRVFSLEFSLDGSTLLSASADGTVRVWDAEPQGRRCKPPSGGRSSIPDRWPTRSGSE